MAKNQPHSVSYDIHSSSTIKSAQDLQASTIKNKDKYISKKFKGLLRKVRKYFSFNHATYKTVLTLGYKCVTALHVLLTYSHIFRVILHNLIPNLSVKENLNESTSATDHI